MTIFVALHGKMSYNWSIGNKKGENP